MNVYRGSFERTGRYWEFHPYEFMEAIVIANTESEALGLVLDYYPKTKAANWSIDLINTNRLSVIHTYEQ